MPFFPAFSCCGMSGERIRTALAIQRGHSKDGIWLERWEEIEFALFFVCSFCFCFLPMLHGMLDPGVLLPLTWGWTQAPSVERWSLNHWTAKEVCALLFLSSWKLHLPGSTILSKISVFAGAVWPCANLGSMFWIKSTRDSCLPRWGFVSLTVESVAHTCSSERAGLNKRW